jgi:hypothetical protein
MNIYTKYATFVPVFLTDTENNSATVRVVLLWCIYCKLTCKFFTVTRYENINKFCMKHSSQLLRFCECKIIISFNVERIPVLTCLHPLQNLNVLSQKNKFMDQQAAREITSDLSLYNDWLPAGWSGIDPRCKLGILLFDTVSVAGLGPIQPSIEWVPVALPLWVMRPGLEPRSFNT